MNINFQDRKLIPIWKKLLYGSRLSLEDGLTLFKTDDLISLGKMAHFARERRSGDAVYFVVNQKIEHTNICVLSCKFCDFATKKGMPDAYEMTTEEILSRLTPDIREVHITGGMPAHWPWQRYLDIVRAIHEKFSQADIKAFTAVEIDFFSKKFKLPIKEVLRELKSAGVQTLPGGGAEIFTERVRRLLFPQKIGAKGYLEVHKTAHRLGIPTNCTMLYGHIETPEERLIHMIKLRETQDETGGFLSFVPLAFQPGDTGIKPNYQFTSAIDDLKTIAVARLMLDNIPHIKAYWVMLTEEVASVALNFGADDLDGTVGSERIAHDAGATSPMQLAKDQIIRIIRAAGKVPVERDAFYNPVNIFAEKVIGKIPYLNSVPFYHNMERGVFRILPVTPRQMGILSKKGELDAGLFSLMDYLEQEDTLELMGWCLATRDQVKSVMLFSKEGWAELNGKKIGITNSTATSVKLLTVLLEQKYGVHAEFVRLHAGVNDYSGYDAVLLIGDEALKCNKYCLAGFELAFDLATEWYNWQKLPFVFAVWARRKSLPAEYSQDLNRLIEQSLAKSSGLLGKISEFYGKDIGLTKEEVKEYLGGFIFCLGVREREAIQQFRKFYSKINAAANQSLSGG